MTIFDLGGQCFALGARREPNLRARICTCDEKRDLPREVHTMYPGSDFPANTFSGVPGGPTILLLIGLSRAEVGSPAVMLSVC